MNPLLSPGRLLPAFAHVQVGLAYAREHMAIGYSACGFDPLAQIPIKSTNCDSSTGFDR